MSNDDLEEIKAALENVKSSEVKFDDTSCGVIAQELSSVLDDTITIDSSTLSSLWNSTNGTTYYTVGSSSMAGNYTISSPWNTITTNQPSLTVTGKSTFEDDITVKGISILKTLEDINKRLAILVPDPAKLEQFEALRKAYEHYKTLEALCDIQPKTDEK